MITSGAIPTECWIWCCTWRQISLCELTLQSRNDAVKKGLPIIGEPFCVLIEVAKGQLTYPFPSQVGHFWSGVHIWPSAAFPCHSLLVSHTPSIIFFPIQVGQTSFFSSCAIVTSILIVITILKPARTLQQHGEKTSTKKPIMKGGPLLDRFVLEVLFFGWSSQP